jgi:hypothetical protein
VRCDRPELRTSAFCGRGEPRFLAQASNRELELFRTESSLDDVRKLGSMCAHPITITEDEVFCDLSRYLRLRSSVAP